MTHCDHNDDNDHDDYVLVQEALHYKETILETQLIERSESILMIESKPEEEVESKPEDRVRYYTMAIDCFHQQRTTLNHQVHVSNWEPRLQFHELLDVCEDYHSGFGVYDLFERVL